MGRSPISRRPGRRPNLTLIPDALVDRVRVEDGRATGVRTADGREVRGRQVVLCAGAYGSPAILLRSGIGPARDLGDLGIPIVADRPGVGAHLLDHPNLIFADGEDFAPYVVKPEFAPADQSVIPLLIKARSRQTAEDIDIYLIYGCLHDEARGRWVAFFGVNLEVAQSTGRVRLTSSDPEATLEIDHRYFAVPSDLEALCDGTELDRAADLDAAARDGGRSCSRQSASSGANATNSAPGFAIGSRHAFIRRAPAGWALPATHRRWSITRGGSMA